MGWVRAVRAVAGRSRCPGAAGAGCRTARTHAEPGSGAADSRSRSGRAARGGRSDPSLHDRVHSRHLDPAVHGLDTCVLEDGVEQAGDLAVTIPDQDPRPAAGILKVHDEVPGGLDDPGRRGMRSRTQLNGTGRTQPALWFPGVRTAFSPDLPVSGPATGRGLSRWAASPLRPGPGHYRAGCLPCRPGRVLPEGT